MENFGKTLLDKPAVAPCGEKCGLALAEPVAHFFNKLLNRGNKIAPAYDLLPWTSPVIKTAINHASAGTLSPSIYWSSLEIQSLFMLVRCSKRLDPECLVHAFRQPHGDYPSRLRILRRDRPPLP